MKKILLTSLVVFIICFAKNNAQENSIFVHREVREAIKKGTRTLTGKPGANYWQNEISYTIKASFDPETGKVEGQETITFKNNSPTRLRTIYFNTNQNLFQKSVTRDRYVDQGDVHDGILLKKITADGKSVRIPKDAGTVQSISLPTSLDTGAIVKLYIEWELKMPASTQIRVGKYGKNVWFVGYWYPQIAVMDDVYGWDNIPYDGLHEFYMPFADYDVQITSPAKSIIWATGIWQNPDEILNKKYLKRYNGALEASKVIHIVGKEELKDDITQKKSEHTYHYEAKYVSDFSFATSDHYLWDGQSIVVDKKTGRKAFIQTAYNPKSKDFYDVINMSRKTLRYLSDSMPGIPYPYPRMTVFNGGGGMEFPMMVNDRSSWNMKSAFNLTSHEIAHTYFPFYMGINQERFSWMDEGWAMFLPADLQEQLYSNNTEAATSARTFARHAGTSLELPMMVPSFFHKGYEYFVDSYYRPELAYRTLQNLLGKELFLKALQEYMYRWNGKHPTPYDFFFTFNDLAGEDLAWFWKPWFFEMCYSDLAIEKVDKTDEGYNIAIKNKGGLPLSADLNFVFADGSKEKLTRSPEIWKDGNDLFMISFPTKKKIKSINLGNSRIPDSDMSDNRQVFK